MPISKKLVQALTGAAVVLSLAAPQVSSARTVATTDTTGTSQNSTTTFCTRLANVSSTLDARISDHEQRWTSNKQNVLQTIQTNQERRATELTKIRGDENAMRDAQLAKLLARATTDAQKQAVNDFSATLKTALTTRRAAVDAAILAFNTSVDSDVAARQTTLQNALSALKTAIDDAITTAKASCSANTDPATVRSTLVSSINAARTAFQTAQKNADKIGPQIQALRLIRNTAIKNAFAAFDTAMKAARATLKAAFASA